MDIELRNDRIPRNPFDRQFLDMNHVVIQGESVLMRASYEGHVDVVKTLIEAGANVNLTDEVSNVMQGNHLGLCRKALE